jgi:ABC-type enterochelin transport system permease subunit
LFGGLMITGVALDVSSAVTSLSDEFTPDSDVARVLGTAGAIIGLTGLIGGAVVVAATTRIAQRAQALPSWAVWTSYAVAVLCMSGFWIRAAAPISLFPGVSPINRNTVRDQPKAKLHPSAEVTHRV